MSTMMNMASLHQHQLKLIQKQESYNKGVAEYNLNKVIRQYKSAINSAENSNEARGLAEGLQSILQTFGKSLADVDGLNTDLMNAVDGAAGKAGHKQKGTAYDKKIISDLSDEFGIDVKKRGTTKDWLQKAKNDDRVKVLDKNGKDVTAERTGRIKKGDILEVDSKQHGKVRISVGGDGEINGGDDKVLSVGGKTAANSMQQGLNQINQPPQHNQQQNYNNAAQVNQTNPITALNPFEIAQATDPTMNTDNNAYGYFNDEQINNLIAAILNQSMFNITQRENEEYLKQFKAS